MNDILEQPTDISAGTQAEIMWEFYTESRRQIAELQIKRDLYCRQYLAEMCKADIPVFLSSEILEDMSEQVKSDPDKEKTRKFCISLVEEKIFSESFRKENNIEFVGKIIGGWEGEFYTLKYKIGDFIYSFQCPCPRNAKDENYKGQEVWRDRTMYRADCEPVTECNGLVHKLQSVCLPTYDWKECVTAIEKHVEQMKLGGENVQLC